MTDMTRIRELLAKAEKKNVNAYMQDDGTWHVNWLQGYGRCNRIKSFVVTPAQFAALKTEFPNVWNGEK